MRLILVWMLQFIYEYIFNAKVCYVSENAINKISNLLYHIVRHIHITNLHRVFLTPSEPSAPVHSTSSPTHSLPGLLNAQCSIQIHHIKNTWFYSLYVFTSSSSFSFCVFIFLFLSVFGCRWADSRNWTNTDTKNHWQ